MIWNWLIGGTDAHAKNYSLLLAGRQVRLAPLYDVASALPYERHERELKMAMKVGGDYRLYPHRNPWPKAAEELNLNLDTLTARVIEFATRAPLVFSEIVDSPEVRSLESPLPDRLQELVGDRAKRCLSLFD